MNWKVLNMSDCTIQDIFQSYGAEYTKLHKLSKEQWQVYNAIINCKTKNLGVHTITCKDCGVAFTGYNSCRNRHCPMCQSYKREQWIQNETSYLLDCPYFHIVTTVPAELNEIALYNKKEFYNILFKATSESILELANDPKWLGAKVGITSILHTWGSSMEFHPHIHSIVTGGGLKNNTWVEVEKDYLFKVQVLSSLFKGKVLSMLKSEKLTLPNNLKHLSDIKNLNKFLEPLYEKDWVTYIEPPQGAPENVIEYIGRYAFRVAISNQRIKDISDNKITFEYKDYRDNGKVKLMTIDAFEFIRRFFLHVLPKNFTKVKHYGILSNRYKKSTIRLCRLLKRECVNSNFISEIAKRTLIEFKCPSCGNSTFSYNFFYPYCRS